MKTKTLFLTLFLVVNTAIYSQPQGERFFGVHISAGYSAFSLDEIKNNYDDLTQSFVTYYNIPLVTQKKFPANGVFGGSVFFKISDLRINAGFSYASTKAYTLYSDFVGDLDMIGSVKSYIYYVGASRIITNSLVIKPFVEANIGYIYGVYDLERKIILKQPNYYEETVKNEVSGSGLFFEPAIGALYKFSFFEIDVKGGYRYAIIGKLSGDLQIPFYRMQISDAQMNMDMSGFFISSGVSFTLN